MTVGGKCGQDLTQPSLDRGEIPDDAAHHAVVDAGVGDDGAHAADRLDAAAARLGVRVRDLQVRGEAVPGARIEVVTEGILTRMIQDDPMLESVAAILFDEPLTALIFAGLAVTIYARIDDWKRGRR